MSCPIILEESLYNEISENKLSQGILFFFCVVCFVGSSIVLISLYRSRPLSPHLLLVASLSAADLILCSDAALFLLYFNKQPGLVGSCQTNAFFSTFGVLVSLMSFGMITIERYLVICHGLENHSLKTIISIAIVYTYSIITSSIIMTSPDHVNLIGGMLCGPSFCSQTLTMIIINSSFVIVVLGFLASVIYCPYKILKIYSSANSTVGDSIHAAENLKANTDRKKNERKLFIKLSIITGMFVIMLSPLAIALVYEITTKNQSPDWLMYFYDLCLGGNSALNPLLLYALDVNVKNRVNQFLGIQFRSRPAASPKQAKKVAEKSLNVKETANIDMKDTVKISTLSR